MVQEQTEDQHTREENMIEIEDTASEDKKPFTSAQRMARIAFWLLVVLAIIAFALFGVTTLMHHPPNNDNSDSLSMIHGTIAFASQYIPLA